MTVKAYKLLCIPFLYNCPTTASILDVLLDKLGSMQTFTSARLPTSDPRL